MSIPEEEKRDLLIFEKETRTMEKNIVGGAIASTQVLR